jgi:hypothetical protein
MIFMPRRFSGSLLSVLMPILCASPAAMAQEMPSELVNPAATLTSKPAVLVAPGKDLPWLGLQVTRADDAIRAQLPKLPKGVGFLVASIDAQGPARAAGVQPYDVLWMWNDQILINEAQLEVLLSLKQINDKVELRLFRAGEEKTCKISLGRQPTPTPITAGPTIESLKNPTAIPRLEPTRPLDVNSRMARLEDGNAVLEMEVRSEGTWLTITDDAGEVVFDEFLNDDSRKKLPAVWHDRVDTLQKSMQRGCAHRDDRGRSGPRKTSSPSSNEKIDPAPIVPMTPVSAPE